MNDLLAIAYRATAGSTHHTHRMAAVLARGGRVLAVEHNLESWNGHCERRVLRPHLDTVGTTLIVVRSNGGISKPCPRCMEVVRAAGVKKLVYVDIEGKTVIERV